MIPVNSDLVKRVRYFGYPDKIRLVIDTYEKYLTQFTAFLIDEGLTIQVGQGSAEVIEESSESIASHIHKPNKE